MGEFLVRELFIRCASRIYSMSRRTPAHARLHPQIRQDVQANNNDLGLKEPGMVQP
jgi:hypothetical protein